MHATQAVYMLGVDGWQWLCVCCVVDWGYWRGMYCDTQSSDSTCSVHCMCSPEPEESHEDTLLFHDSTIWWWTLSSVHCGTRWVPRGSDTSVCPRVCLGPVGALCQAVEARKNLVGRMRIIIWKSENGITVTTVLFSHANSRLHLGTLSHFAPWNKPIHGLELFQFATVSPVLPTCANTLDRSRHFEPGTFLNRCHYRDVW